jgi:hypothetical protein
MNQDERGGELLRLLAELEHEIEAIKQAIAPRRSEPDGLVARLDRKAPRVEPEAPSGSTLRQRLAKASSS